MATRKLSTRPPETRFGWGTTEDVTGALTRLRDEPLPVIVPPDILDAVGVRQAFQVAYRDHPVYRAAYEWSIAARGGPDRAPVLPLLSTALTNVSVHAMHRYFAGRAVAASAPISDAPF